MISYTSRALTPTEQRYSQIERECLAIVYACEHNKLYLNGHDFKLFSDHKPIVNLLNNPNSRVPLRIKRMTLRLQGYSFDLQHVTGENNISDYNSRHPANSEYTDHKIESYINNIIDNTCPNAISLGNIKNETQNDPVLQTIIKLTRNNTWFKLDKPSRYPEIQQHLSQLIPYRNVRNELTINETSNILLKANRIVIPQKYQDKVV